MLEFDVAATVTSLSKGKLVPVKVEKTIKASNKLDCITKFKKHLHKQGYTLHVLLDVQSFRRNIRKERVKVSDEIGRASCRERV